MQSGLRKLPSWRNESVGSVGSVEFVGSVRSVGSVEFVESVGSVEFVESVEPFGSVGYFACLSNKGAAVCRVLSTI
jgi:hypothetical protein